MKVSIVLQYLKYNETINVKNYIHILTSFNFQRPIIIFNLLPPTGFMEKILKLSHKTFLKRVFI